MLKRRVDPIAHARRRVLLAGSIPTIVAAVLALARPASLAPIERRSYDVLVRQAGTRPPTQEIAIVDVDERSLSTIGQWPWRRDTMGHLVGRIRDAGASVIAVDMIFAEPDRDGQAQAVTRPSGEARSAESPDAAFAAELRRGKAVLGYAFTFDDPPSGSARCVLHPLNLPIVQPPGETQLSPLFRASGAVCALPTLAEAAGASGFLNAAPDADGILRRVPLLVEQDDGVYPSLALRAVMAAMPPRQNLLRVANVNTAALELGDTGVPLDARGNLLLRYRGGRRAFPYVSAVDVLEGRLPKGGFADQIVFVGATALGTREVVATPLDTLFAGVEVQATVADNLLQRDFFRRHEHAVAIEVQAVLGAGIALSLLVGRAGLAWGALGALGGLWALWSGAVWLLSTHGLFLSPAFPSIGLIAALGSMTLARLSVERGRAERAGGDRATTQRLLVQSLLSLTEVRDSETGRHARRTERYVRLLAEELARHPRYAGYLTNDRIDLLATLAPLHDIGKVGVPDRLLNKPGQLTDDEVAEMRKHPAFGRDVILQAKQRAGVHDHVVLDLATDIVYTHHERWDGSGYPQGLKHEEIPIPGRLMAVVDVYDALMTRRLYRRPATHEEAVRSIVEGSGAHFDPAIVEAFVRIAPAFARLPDLANL